jgi:hypothetical protein
MFPLEVRVVRRGVGVYSDVFMSGIDFLARRPPADEAPPEVGEPLDVGGLYEDTDALNIDPPPLGEELATRNERLSACVE